MAYTTEILVWRSYVIEVISDPDPFNIASYNREA